MIFHRLSSAISLAIALGLSAGVSACARQTAPVTEPPIVATPPPPPLFTDDERAALVTYWCTPGRYVINGSPDATKIGPYVVRLTTEGSIWFHAYREATAGKTKTAPTEMVHGPTTGANASWEPWVAAKWAFDLYLARQSAQAANLAVFPAVIPPPTAVPPAPGPIPSTLLAACGNAPRFIGVYAPLSYNITFDDGDSYAYTDNPKMPDRYAWLRFPNGVSTGGLKLVKMPDADKAAVFAAAGFPPAEQHIWEAVSDYEGGFDAVQSYDTGYVSVGFIQFVTMSDSKHDLSLVLLNEKAVDPTSFQTDFHQYGIDVYPDQTMVAVDPETGAELDGPDAVLKLIDDKRLLAVFQRAGRRTPFRIAQIKIAKTKYWPVDDPVMVTLKNGATLTGIVGDVIHSDAGLATFLDRKINVGNCRVLSGAVTDVMNAHKCPGKTLAEALPFEREIVAACKYRGDFLNDKTLGQPPVVKVDGAK